mgnify:CR=1 FL=1
MKIKSEVCGMTKKQKRMLVRIIISFVLFAALMVAEHTGALEGINTWILFVIYLVPYLVIGYDIVYKAVRNISHGLCGRQVQTVDLSDDGHLSGVCQH